MKADDRSVDEPGRDRAFGPHFIGVCVVGRVLESNPIVAIVALLVLNARSPR
ncbi:MAG: hypothetical protein ACE367_07240 [Acidimicrobiales bacterium]